MSGMERFLYFVRKVAEREEVWGLFADGWAMTADDSERKALPFWPEKEFSQLCAVGEWQHFSSRRIDLDSFVSMWLPGMEKDDLFVALFPTPQNRGIIVPPGELREKLIGESEQYE